MHMYCTSMIINCTDLQIAPNMVIYVIALQLDEYSKLKNTTAKIKLMF